MKTFLDWLVTEGDAQSIIFDIQPRLDAIDDPKELVKQLHRELKLLLKKVPREIDHETYNRIVDALVVHVRNRGGDIPKDKDSIWNASDNDLDATPSLPPSKSSVAQAAASQGKFLPDEDENPLSRRPTSIPVEDDEDDLPSFMRKRR